MFLDSILQAFTSSVSPTLPSDLGNLDDHIDFLLPKIRPHSEDLSEVKFWHSRRWSEVRDDEGFHENLLHIFMPGGEYMLVLDGNIIKGSWKQLGSYNTLILEVGGKSELFDLKFMNVEYLILSKHGDQARKGNRKYFLLVHEPLIQLDWRNLMERLAKTWQESDSNIWMWILFVLLILAIIYMSF